MKVTNVNEILQVIDDVAGQAEWTMYTTAFYPVFRTYVLAVYMAHDSVTQVSTRDIATDCTYIISRYCADIIKMGHHNRCKIDEGIVQYSSLSEDIGAIFGALQLAFLDTDG